MTNATFVDPPRGLPEGFPVGPVGKFHVSDYACQVRLTRPGSDKIEHWQLNIETMEWGPFVPRYDFRGILA